MHIHALASTKPMCTLVAIAGIFTSDCDPPPPHKSCQRCSWCQHSSFNTLHSEDYSMSYPNLQKTALLCNGVNTSGRAVRCVRVLLWGITVGKCVCATAAGLMWGAAQASRFDWTPGCVQALTPSELNLANSWLKGVLSPLKCHSFIPSVKTKQYPPCATLLTGPLHHETAAINWFYSLTWTRSVRTDVAPVLDT